MPVRTVVQRGPKEKKVVAFAIDWPGWSRGAKDPAAALELLEGYRDRYRPVARLAGVGDEFDEAGALELVEDHVGVGSTDFWGISFAPSSFEQGPMGEEELDRKLTLLQAAWRYFDDVAARVSPELEKGPRGGGRDRDEIVRHVVGNERGDLARRIGVVAPSDGLLTPTGLRSHRVAYVAAMREYNADGKWRGAETGRSLCCCGTPRSTSSITPGRCRTRTSRNEELDRGTVRDGDECRTYVQSTDRRLDR